MTAISPNDALQFTLRQLEDDLASSGNRVALAALGSEYLAATTIDVNVEGIPSGGFSFVWTDDFSAVDLADQLQEFLADEIGAWPQCPMCTRPLVPAMREGAAAWICDEHGEVAPFGELGDTSTPRE